MKAIISYADKTIPCIVESLPIYKYEPNGHSHWLPMFVKTKFNDLFNDSPTAFRINEFGKDNVIVHVWMIKSYYSNNGEIRINFEKAGLI